MAAIIVTLGPVVPLNELKIPKTVPNNPTHGASEAIVARPYTPALISSCTTADDRLDARPTASSISLIAPS